METSPQIDTQIDCAATKKDDTNAWKVFKSNKPGMIGLYILVIFTLIAILAPIISPYEPMVQDPINRAAPPSAEHWLGTDTMGRDMLSRIIYGSQTSLFVGFAAVTISAVIGTTIGLLAGYIGGWVDEILMRIIESIMALPLLLLGMMLLVALGSNVSTLIIALSIGLIPGIARISRGPTMSLKNSEFVKAAIVSGSGPIKIIFKHILPNILGAVLVVASLNMAAAIRIEATLSFLGLGVQPPTPTWGNIIKDGLNFMTINPFLVLFPGFALMIVVIAFNLVGDSLRDSIDPHLKRQRK
ncbi:ABC transporter permease [Bacillus dakarensis]|uniref:ABC transporter permease n=1 Tax=Robertmurraya dakarensis TaxID=1926278 RepID=UPI000A005EAC|nr:ABC transporter permease [Bacillus dakarensis]